MAHLFLDTVQINTAGNGKRVVWMSDWLSVDSLIKRGLLREEYIGNSFNAYEITVTAKGFAQATIEASQPFVPFGAN